MASNFVNQAGVSKLQYRFKHISELTEKETVKELKEIGEDLKAESQDVVPYREGDLRNSAYVNQFWEDGNPYVEVGYRAEYSIAVHENLDPNVEWTTEGTGPKFLERPYAANKTRYAERLKDAGRRALRG